MVERVSVGGRLHIGFSNLSLSRDRLYGGIGLSLSTPRTVVSAKPADSVKSDSPVVRDYAQQAVSVLDVEGASVSVESALPRHIGLGSGTRLALAVLTAIATAYEKEPAVREHAPTLGRGGRSGVGVATFLADGFVVDAGHPTDSFTPKPPAAGEWTVPPVVVRQSVPENWRFVIAIPNAPSGRSGTDEDGVMRNVVEDAAPSVSDTVGRNLLERVLPGIVTQDIDTAGAGLEGIDRANGSWYAAVQGGIYRPPAGLIIDHLRQESAATGVGQSSWGPAVWALTTKMQADSVVTEAHTALDDVGCGGSVVVGSVSGGSARNV